jgi:hypothetical protein
VAIGFTDSYRTSDYGEPIVGLKSYVLSPYVDESRMHSIVQHVLEARQFVEDQMSGKNKSKRSTPTAWDSA